MSNCFDRDHAPGAVQLARRITAQLPHAAGRPSTQILRHYDLLAAAASNGRALSAQLRPIMPVSA
jgi:hypothetical protein